jgi:FkbM family methyltransferase
MMMFARRITKRSFTSLLSHDLFARRLNRLLRPFAARIPRRIRTVLPVVGPFRLCSPYVGVCFDIITDRDDPSAAWFFWNGLESFEAPTQMLLSRLLASTDTFVDVGANIGVYSLLGAAFRRTLRIHAFEPEPSARERLRRNVAVNGFTNVSVHPEALSDTPGEAPLFVPKTSTAESSLLPKFRQNTSPVSVRVARLDDLVGTSIGKIDLLKIDTEGTEDKVLRGAMATIQRDRPFIICEVLAREPAELALQPLLDEAGYVPFLLTRGGIEKRVPIFGDPDYVDLNFVFVHEAQVQSVGTLFS